MSQLSRLGDHRPVADTSDEVWERVQAVDLDAPFGASRKVIPIMIEHDGGVVLATMSPSWAWNQVFLKPRAEVLTTLGLYAESIEMTLSTSATMDCIGGAGTFDRVFLTRIVAVIMASLI
jgi:NAD(P)-dependent dehydrogenase (short-subunit alcohol dehydrogenase family)